MGSQRVGQGDSSDLARRAGGLGRADPGRPQDVSPAARRQVVSGHPSHGAKEDPLCHAPFLFFGSARLTPPFCFLTPSLSGLVRSEDPLRSQALLTRLVVVVDCDLGSLQELSLQHPVDPEAEHRVFFVGELEEGRTV